MRCYKQRPLSSCWSLSVNFLVNYKKSHLLPTQVITFVGFIVDSTKRQLSLPPKKMRQIKEEAKKLLRKERGSISMSTGMLHRETDSSNIGHLSSTFALQRSAAAETQCPQESRIQGTSGESTPYQCTRVVGSLFWSQSGHKTQKRDKHSTVVGQSDSSVSYQQNGRY